MLDSINENPELIWNETIKNTIKARVWNECDSLFTLQKNDPGVKWNAVIFYDFVDLFFNRNRKLIL